MVVHISADDAMAACHTRQFADRVGNRDYASIDELLSCARDAWRTRVTVAGWLEAFAAHPQIGDAAAIRAKFAAGAGAAQRRFGALSTDEQGAALGSGDEALLAELAALNRSYLEKFGHIFIVCASGKAAPEILGELRRRVRASPLEELRAAAAEQWAITELRLRKAWEAAAAAAAGGASAAAAAAAAKASSAAAAPSSLFAAGPMSGAAATAAAGRAAARTEQIGRHLAAPAAGGSGAPPGGGRSPITTHVLDTALGLPARDMAVELHVLRQGAAASGGGGGGGAAAENNDDRAAAADDAFAAAAAGWTLLCAARTDAEGRVGGLLPPGSALEPGATYRVRFATGPYLVAMARRFYGGQGGGGIEGGGEGAGAAPLRRPPPGFPFAHASPTAPPFYPRADVEFTVPRDPQARRAHYHVPLLLSPYGFSTYRGS